MPGPRADTIGSQRPGLPRDLRAVIEIRRQFAYPADSDGLEIQVTLRPRLGRGPMREARENMRLNDRLGHQLFDAGVPALAVGTGAMVVELATHRLHDGAG